jgi:hypothetical protein
MNLVKQRVSNPRFYPLSLPRLLALNLGTLAFTLKKALIRKALCYTWFVQTGILSPA